MNIIRKFNSGAILFLAASILFSCNLEDFNLKKLTNGEDIIPDVFAPLAYGTFKVENLVTVPISDAFPIPTGGLTLDPVLLNKTGTTFSLAAIDSVYLFTHFTNNTPCTIAFEMSFIDKVSGNPSGKIFTSEMIPPGAIDQKIEFRLGSIDMDNLQNASDIKLDFKISSPDGANPILYGEVKKTLFTTKISFYAPVNLRKL